MAWSYDPGQMNVQLNRVRLLLGDIDENDQQMQDEELQLFIDVSSSDGGAVVLAARALMSRYARDVDLWVGDLKILESQRYRHYEALVGDTTAALAGLRGVPYAGGIRYSSKEEVTSNDDLVRPSFTIGMHDNTSGE